MSRRVGPPLADRARREARVVARASRGFRGLAALLAVAFVAACAAVSVLPPAEVRQSLAPTGVLRVGVYSGSPTSMVVDAATGETRGLAVDLGDQLAGRLGVAARRVELATIADVVAAIKAGDVDFTIANASPARAADVRFSKPVLTLELGYLVPAGSRAVAAADLDRPGTRIGVTQGSTSQGTLPGRLQAAAIVVAPSVTEAVAMLGSGRLDAFATNKAILFQMADSLPGARVLDGRWGTEDLAIAIPKGRALGAAYVDRFVVDAEASGLVRGAAQRAGLRGVAPP